MLKLLVGLSAATCAGVAIGKKYGEVKMAYIWAKAHPEDPSSEEIVEWYEEFTSNLHRLRQNSRR